MFIKSDNFRKKGFVCFIALLQVLFFISCDTSSKSNTSSNSPEITSEKSAAMGRYSETECKIDRELLFSELPFFNEKGILSLLIYTADEWGNDARQIKGLHETTLSEYQLKNGDDWEVLETSVFSKLSGKTSVSNMCYDGGNMYFVFIKIWDDVASQHIGKIDASGKFTELPINLGAYSDEMMAFDILDGKSKENMTEIILSGDISIDVGQLIVHDGYIYVLKKSSISVYSLEGVLINTFGSNEREFVIKGNQVITTNSDGSLFRIYDSEGRNLIMEVNHSLPGKIMALGIGLNDELYIATKKGIYRQEDNGAKWLQIVDGQNTAISDSSIVFSKLYCLPDEKFLLSGYDAYRTGFGMCRTFYYEYNPEIPAQRITMLKVATLYPNETLEYAALEFAKKHQDATVKIDVLTEVYPDLPIASIINTLNTQIVAGDGPDVLLLDELPMQSYTKQNLFMPLNDLLLNGIEKKDYYNNILSAHETNGKIVAIPASFELPAAASFLFAGGQVNMEYYQSLDEDVNTSDWVEGRFYMGKEEYIIPPECTVYTEEANINLAQIYSWAIANQEKNSVYSRSPAVIAKDFYDSSFSDFYTNGKFKKEEFIKYVQLVEKISEIGPEFQSMTDGAKIFTANGHSPILVPTEDNTGKIDKTFLASNEALSVYSVTLQGLLDFLMFDNVAAKMIPQAMDQIEVVDMNTMLPDYREAFHLLGDAFIPTCNLAILKSTENSALAQEFLLTALNSSVQNKMFINGFPVRKDCYQRDFWLEFNYSILLVTQDDEYRKEFTWPLPLSMNMLMNAVETLDFSIPKNKALKENVLELLNAYFQGKDNAENVAKKVELLFAQTAF